MLEREDPGSTRGAGERRPAQTWLQAMAAPITLAGLGLLWFVARSAVVADMLSGGLARLGDPAVQRSSAALFRALGNPDLFAVESGLGLTQALVSGSFCIALLGLSRWTKPKLGPCQKRALPVVAALAVVAGVSLSWVALSAIARFGTQGDLPRAHPHFEACVHVRGALGHWDLRPTGYTPLQGAKGIEFQFAPDQELAALRLGAERGGDGGLELVFREAGRAPVRIAERECEQAEGVAAFRPAQFTTREGLVPTAPLHISCPLAGLDMHALLNPGYSKRQLKAFGSTPLVRGARDGFLVGLTLLALAVVLGVEALTTGGAATGSSVPLVLKLVGMLVLALFTASGVHHSSADGGVQHPLQADVPHLDGWLGAGHAEKGPWQATPERCLSGRDRGLTGTIFQFPRDNEVKEMHMDTERQVDQQIEVLFADPNRPSLRVRERDCTFMVGTTQILRVRMSGQTADEVQGELHFACPLDGLSGHFFYAGCRD